MYREFLQFFVIWFHICTTVGFDCREFWSKNKKYLRDIPFKYNHIMSISQFETIIGGLNYTCRDPAAYKDWLREVSKMLEEWNDNMKVAEQMDMPRNYGCTKKSMAVWKRVPHNMLLEFGYIIWNRTCGREERVTRGAKEIS